MPTGRHKFGERNRENDQEVDVKGHRKEWFVQEEDRDADWNGHIDLRKNHLDHRQLEGRGEGGKGGGDDPGGEAAFLRL